MKQLSEHLGQLSEMTTIGLTISENQKVLAFETWLNRLKTRGVRVDYAIEYYEESEYYAVDIFNCYVNGLTLELLADLLKSLKIFK